MEENSKSEKVPFLKIIELLREENSFLRKENEMLTKQIELYRSEIKVNEQRNAAYREKTDHLIELLSDTQKNFDNEVIKNENEQQNLAGSSSKEAFRSSENEHELVKNDNEEEADEDKIQNNE